jgi:hypothetical protein
LFALKSLGADDCLEVLPAVRDGLRVNGAFFAAGRFFLTGVGAFFATGRFFLADVEAFFFALVPLRAGACFLTAVFFADFLEA